MTFHRAYVDFYFDGRDNPLAAELDFEPLAKKFLAGQGVRDIALGAAREICKALEIDGSEKIWAKKRANRAAIEVAGGDASKAYAMYQAGRTEQLACDLEADILAEAGELLDAEEDDDDEEEAHLENDADEAQRT